MIIKIEFEHFKGIESTFVNASKTILQNYAIQTRSIFIYKILYVLFSSLRKIVAQREAIQDFLIPCQRLVSTSSACEEQRSDGNLEAVSTRSSRISSISLSRGELVPLGEYR